MLICVDVKSTEQLYRIDNKSAGLPVNNQFTLQPTSKAHTFRIESSAVKHLNIYYCFIAE